MALTRGRAHTAPAVPSACFLLLLLITSSSLLSPASRRAESGGKSILGDASSSSGKAWGGSYEELQSISGGEARCAYLRAQNSAYSPVGYVDYLRLRRRTGGRVRRARAVARGALLPPGRHLKDHTIGSRTQATSLLCCPWYHDWDLSEILGAPKGSTTINVFSECTKAESFLPFGSGSRACVGQKFVVLAISMLIASLLRSYEV
ncbi:uncharacterized protein [Zea mays]|uniref:Uncharacterized protein n=1 Tax=Zea mays TaxID=4577 RepID=A0A804QJ67_MAIZE|nr:uncharacterized protein LOC103634680 isoform X2 [Zea mays]XP_020397940.1 uncharacterized protein LOC103634680 isoform X2 [Zea mays]|eukprot:XP_020397939.1 uncharacterized protein LOC103634680 isoform X2 [Zea mays]